MWRKPLVGEVSCQRPRVVQKMLPTQLVVSLPSALRIAALYMLVRGGIGLVWPLLRLGPNHPEFQAQSAAYRSGAHSRELILSVACIVAGVGLFWHHAWGRMLALALLIIGTIYDANSFAWGFSSGPPTPRVRLLSHVIVVAWNGMWFYIIYRAEL
jgi:hypothetical protein